MLDVNRLDEASRRGRNVTELVNKFKELNQRRKQLQGAIDGLRQERNAASKRMSKVDKKSDEFAATRDSLRTLSQDIKVKEKELDQSATEARELHMLIPNAPHESVPDGTDESARPRRGQLRR